MNEIAASMLAWIGASLMVIAMCGWLVAGFVSMADGD